MGFEAADKLEFCHVEFGGDIIEFEDVSEFTVDHVFGFTYKAVVRSAAAIVAAAGEVGAEIDQKLMAEGVVVTMLHRRREIDNIPGKFRVMTYRCGQSERFFLICCRGKELGLYVEHGVYQICPAFTRNTAMKVAGIEEHYSTLFYGVCLAVDIKFLNSMQGDPE